MGGLFIVPIPIAVPLILIILCLMPATPISWPAIIIYKTYLGWREGDKKPPWEIAKDCGSWIALSIIIPWITVMVLWLMCIAQLFYLPFYLAWLVTALIGLPAEVYNLFLLLKAWRQQQEEQQQQPTTTQVIEKSSDPQHSPEPKRYAFTILPSSSSIRILTIHPSQSLNAPLEGSLGIANLNTHPTYDALSYTWTTDPDPDHTSSSSSSIPSSVCLFSSPSSPPSNLTISHNCALALRRLRHPTQPRKLWIDAVCINQSDLSERAQQVSLMARIFCTARKVAVYTGESDSETDALYDWLNDIDLDRLSVLPSRPFLGSNRGHTGSGVLSGWFGLLPGWLSDGSYSDEVSIHLEQSLRIARGWKERIQKWGRELWSIYYLKKIPKRPAEPRELKRVLRRYFSRRWFRRVWVLQEVSLPDLGRVEILCGGKKTTGERGMHLLGMLMRDSHGGESEGDELKGLDVWRFFVLLRSRGLGKKKNGAKRSHLLDILIETRGRECEDPRDKIFGVLNIARGLDGADLVGNSAGSEESETKVCYFDSVSTVYASYSALFIRRHGPGFFLALIKSESKVKGLPSWSADWTVSWPNQRALQGIDFPARSRVAGEKDKALEFDGPEKDKTGQGRIALKIMRPRIVRGFFAWTGQHDGDERIQIVEVKQLDKDEVLMEMYPGLAVLLRREPGTDHEYYTFVRVCPHSLSRGGVERLVANWSRAVVYQENVGCVAEGGSSPRGYLGRTRVWRIV
ncbi:heterokaryon incompatibility protein-domain-containing protein [Cladorrhinum sp. PSN332]|nr:heterokaryon incompatibility protein-domain-containing protein [Cladorrhinum sp. PSN332]